MYEFWEYKLMFSKSENIYNILFLLILKDLFCKVLLYIYSQLNQQNVKLTQYCV